MSTEITAKHWTENTPGYDEERRGYQLLDPHQPVHIVGATSPQDVQQAVRYAREHHSKVAVKASGHGHVTPLDGGVLITTSRLDQVTVDSDNKIARVEAGATWQQVIEAAAPHGLAPLSGSFPGVTAVPYTLGSGLGLMARRYGFAADHVRRIEVVTPDGELRNAEDDPELFWALRGGGGNFGVVTAMEIDLFPVPTLYGGSLYYDLTATPGVLEAWREWTATVPDEVTSAVGMLPFPDIQPIPAELRGKYVAQVQVSIVPHGEDDGPELLRPLRDKLGEPLMDTVTRLPFMESGQIFAEPDRPDAFRSRNILLSELDEQALATIPRLAGPDAPTMCVVGIRHLGGALARKPAIDNAVGHRDAQYSLTVLSPGEDDVHDLHRAILAPWSEYVVGRSLNFSLGPLTEDEVRDAFEPADYNRLTALRARYDPTNLLLPNHRI
ncbi:FAD-binding oxidoreductase [Kribbella catacumbae]|uniref:FAD-binding oxidoreductase n=1 Tax=Kribbella catacumbae TaxID=460086 RepID=UPI000360266D|nr:FAD-binding oxidoreductase [Kribbella catacumbae]